MQRRDALKFMALASATTALGVAEAKDNSSTGTAPRSPTAKESKPMSNANELVVGYLAAWNERDVKRRREIIARTWTDAGGYVDSHRHGEGHDAIDAMIDSAQQKFPGYRLRLISKIENHNGYLRFSWAAGGTEQAPLYIGGTDFAMVASDGRLQSVVGFVDAAPAPAPTN